MKNRADMNRDPHRRGNTRSGRMGASLLLVLAIGMVGLMPTIASAHPTFKMNIVNLSAEQASTTQEYTLRTLVATTCSSFMAGGYGACGMIDATISWWTDPSSVKVATRRISLAGGPLEFKISASDVQAPTLHYRIVASQAWNRSECLVPGSTCPSKQTASTQLYGRTQVS